MPFRQTVMGSTNTIGNVWEWTASAFVPPPAETVKKSCSAPEEPGGPAARLVVKGGSHVCAPSYCLRYRPAARQGEALDTSAGHIGFRGVVRMSL
jgi:formylglycine-generating enzyme required for sulfatase activity